MTREVVDEPREGGGRPSRLVATERALRHLFEIRNRSLAQFGPAQTERCLRLFDAAVRRIEENPDLLNGEPEFVPGLHFYRVKSHLYRVKSHLLICHREERIVVLLAVLHASMDVADRLGELEPRLAAEIEAIRRPLEGGPH